MNFLFYYVNLIRIILVLMSIAQIYKHNYKKLIPAIVMMAFTFIPCLLSLVHIQLNTLTEFLFPTVTFMAVYLGSGFKFYDSYSWWDRVVHFLSGILFFSFGISLTKKAPEVGLAGILIFSSVFSLAIHEIWEVFEFITDSILHTDHQHWQKHSSVVNHQTENAIQPPGLVDTMVDAIVAIIGTAIACIGWWIYLKL